MMCLILSPQYHSPSSILGEGLVVGGNLIKANPQKGIPFASLEKGKIRALVVGALSLKEVLDAIEIPLDCVQDLETEEGDLEHAFLKLIKGGVAYKDGGLYGSA